MIGPRDNRCWDAGTYEIGSVFFRREQRQGIFVGKGGWCFEFPE